MDYSDWVESNGRVWLHDDMTALAQFAYVNPIIRAFHWYNGSRKKCYKNDFEFGANVAVLLATDTTKFENGSADTLTNVVIEADATALDSIYMDESKFSLLARQGNYIKSVIDLLGNEAGPSRFLATDTMKVDLYISVEAIIDPNDRGSD